MIVDLTHTLKNNMTFYPGSGEPVFNNIRSIETDGYNQIELKINTHTGTHIDAPVHIVPCTKSLDEFDLDKFIGPACVIDCSQVKEISVDLLKENESRIKNVDFILFYAGMQENWNSDQYFNEYPTLTEEAAKWLTDFNLKAVGFDYISVDKMDDFSLINHNILLKNEILIIENMTKLDQLISKDFELNCIPLKIENSDGAPVRVFARM
ncbi:MAG: hydrolase [Marinilabiliales bacterium]|nr:MAG: hydrolase [Marinilabiliales bacterium]